MGEPLHARTKGMSLTLAGDVVKIELECGDDLLAIVLFEDLEQRFRAGGSITLTVPQPACAGSA